MKNLVISVTPDSSLELLAEYTDVIILDKGLINNTHEFYDMVYIRSHFGQQSTLPQNFRNEIDRIVRQVKDRNPNVKFIDNMDNVDAIVDFEDKWHQYKIFSEFIPTTRLCDEAFHSTDFVRPVYKHRLSSRGSGVTWDRIKVIEPLTDWIMQESIDIQEELRVYIILGQVYPIGAVKRSMTEGNKAEGVNARTLTNDEVTFSLNLIKKAPDLDIVGIDIARAADGKLSLMEVNRSPGFAKFYELTGFNLADKLYKF